jgi:hypothetical protein
MNRSYRNPGYGSCKKNRTDHTTHCSPVRDDDWGVWSNQQQVGQPGVTARNSRVHKLSNQQVRQPDDTARNSRVHKMSQGNPQPKNGTVQRKPNRITNRGAMDTQRSQKGNPQPKNGKSQNRKPKPKNGKSQQQGNPQPENGNQQGNPQPETGNKKKRSNKNGPRNQNKHIKMCERLMKDDSAILRILSAPPKQEPTPKLEIVDLIDFNVLVEGVDKSNESFERTKIDELLLSDNEVITPSTDTIEPVSESQTSEDNVQVNNSPNEAKDHIYKESRSQMGFFRTIMNVLKMYKRNRVNLDKLDNHTEFATVDPRVHQALSKVLRVEHKNIDDSLFQYLKNNSHSSYSSYDVKLEHYTHLSRKYYSINKNEPTTPIGVRESQMTIARCAGDRLDDIINLDVVHRHNSIGEWFGRVKTRLFKNKNKKTFHLNSPASNATQ